MAKQTHIVVIYDHTTKSFYYDEDGTEVWIRNLFEPPSNTWCDKEQDYVGGDDKLLAIAVSKFLKLLKGKN